MKLKIVPLLALSATAAQARITSSHRTLQATNPNNDADPTTVITGTGVQDAEITPEATSTSTIEVPNYTSNQCLQWLQGAFDADGDSSDGLSEAEFHSFLLTIEEPPYDSYVNDPWMLKVVHKTLACRCKDLGLGDECCTGPNAEVKFIGLKDDDEGLSNLTEAQRGVAREYRADMCNSIAESFEPVESLVVVTTAATTTTVAATTTTVAATTTKECLQWLHGAFDADSDSSGGLSSDEFHNFLMGIEDPPYVKEYFAQHEDYQSMPWMFKVAHKALACRCEDLGLGDGCCTGEDPEVPIAVMKKTSRQGMTEAQTSIANEYQADFCNVVAASIKKVIEEDRGA